MYENVVSNSMIDSGNIEGIKSYGGSISIHNFEALQAFYEYTHNNNSKLLDEMTTIDYIFVKNGIKVIRHGILNDNLNGFYPSDHMPKICDILFYIT